MSDVRVLVPGATGFVGQRVVEGLRQRGIAHTPLSHHDDLSVVSWAEASHVVNCAAVTPGPGVGPEQYWDGNVAWLERLVPHLDGRHFVHFGTVSALYRVDAYQVSKLVGEHVVRANAGRLASLAVVALPTLDDAGLIERLAVRAEAGERPEITRLRYGYCAPEEVARHVIDDLVLGDAGELRVEVRLLTDQVRAATDAAIVEGPVQDRTARVAGAWATNQEARASFLARWA